MEWASKFFGTGVLPEDLERLLSQQQRQRMGSGALMDAGIAMLANSGYSTTPQTLGQIVGQGLGAGRQSVAAQGAMQQDAMARQQAAQQQAQRQAQWQQYLSTLPQEMQALYGLFPPEEGVKAIASQRGKEGLKRLEAELRPQERYRDLTPEEKRQRGIDPNSPAQINEATGRLVGAQRPPQTTFNISPTAEGPFGSEGNKRSSELYFTMQDKAASAQQGLAAIDALESIFQNVETGKMAEVRGQLGQWLGTGEGADFQASQAIVQDRVFDIINALKGPATDKDAERAQAQIPNMGTDPRARRVVFDYIRRKAAAQMQNYQAATDYMQKNRTLVGFMPPAAMDYGVGTPSQSGSGGRPSNMTGTDLSNMSTEELRRMLEEARRGGQ